MCSIMSPTHPLVTVVTMRGRLPSTKLKISLQIANNEGHLVNGFRNPCSHEQLSSAEEAVLDHMTVSLTSLDDYFGEDTGLIDSIWEILRLEAETRMLLILRT